MPTGVVQYLLNFADAGTAARDPVVGQYYPGGGGPFPNVVPNILIYNNIGGPNPPTPAGIYNPGFALVVSVPLPVNMALLEHPALLLAIEGTNQTEGELIAYQLPEPFASYQFVANAYWPILFVNSLSFPYLNELLAEPGVPLMSDSSDVIFVE